MKQKYVSYGEVIKDDALVQIQGGAVNYWFRCGFGTVGGALAGVGSGPVGIIGGAALGAISSCR